MDGVRVTPLGAEVAVASRVKIAPSSFAIAAPVHKIVTFHPNSLGALIASLPAMVALRESFPGVHITSFVRWPLLPLLENFGAIDEAKPRPGGGVSAQAALMARLRVADFDMALSFSQGSNALILTWATGAEVRAGFVPSRFEAFLTHRVEKTGPLTASAALDLVASVGAHPRGAKLDDFFFIPPEVLGRAEKLTASLPSNWVLVVPQNTRSGSRQSVDKEEFERIWKLNLRELAEFWPLVVVAPRPLGFTPLEGKWPVLDLSSKADALTLAALSLRSRATIGDDSGAIALARVLGKNIVEERDELPLRARYAIGL